LGNLIHFFTLYGEIILCDNSNHYFAQTASRDGKRRSARLYSILLRVGVYVLISVYCS